MATLFYPISTRAVGHGVRSTLLALRLSATQRLPPSKSNCYHIRKSEIDAVRWLDLHCHLTALYRRSHHQGRTGGPRSLQ